MIIYKRDFLVFGLGITIILMNLINVIVENYNVTKGEELASLREALKDVKRENLLIEERILQRSSFVTIDREARSMGYEEVEPNDYLLLK